MGVNNNGHTQIAEDTLIQHGFNSGMSAELFVDPGAKPSENPLKLFMRTFIVSRDEAIAIARLYSKAQRFHNQMAIDDLIAFLALKASIDGRSTTYALQAFVNAVSPETLQQLSGTSQTKKGGRTILGGFRRKTDGNQDGEPAKFI